MQISMFLSAACLAISVGASPAFMVGRNAAEHENHKGRDIPTETSKVPSAVIKRNVTYPDWSKSCKTQNAKLWQDLEVDKYLSDWSDGWFDPLVGTYTDLSFPSAVMKQINIQQDCSVLGTHGCNFEYDTVTVDCNQGAGTSGGDWNALWMFSMKGISNFQSFASSLYDSFNTASNRVIEGDLDQMAQDFSSLAQVAAQSDTVTTNALTISSAVLSGLGALLGPFGAEFEVIGAGLGVASAATSLASGILTATAAATQEANSWANLTETRSATLHKRLSDSSSGLAKSILHYAESIISDNAYMSFNISNPTERYSQSSTSGPGVLKNGVFAELPRDNMFNKYEESMEQSLKGGAISWLWGLERVFITRASNTTLINDSPPCEALLNATQPKQVGSSACDDSTGTMYWFLKAPDVTGFNALVDKGEVGDSVVAPGLDKLADYNLTAVDIAMAALDSQNHGGFQANYTLGSAADFLTGDHKPHMNIIVNLPVCDLDLFADDLPAVDSGLNKELQSSDVVSRAIRQKCPLMTFNDVPFPYDADTLKWLFIG